MATIEKLQKEVNGTKQDMYPVTKLEAVYDDEGNNLETVLDGVAKQGDNQDISLTSIDEKLGKMVLMDETEKEPAINDLLTKIIWI